MKDRNKLKDGGWKEGGTISTVAGNHVTVLQESQYDCSGEHVPPLYTTAG